MDLFQLDFCLGLDDRDMIERGLRARNMNKPSCSVCGESTSIAALRKLPHQSIHESSCLPCFLLNYTQTDQEDIDRIAMVMDKHSL